jgi:hypothetical protein
VPPIDVIGKTSYPGDETSVRGRAAFVYVSSPGEVSSFFTKTPAFDCDVSYVSTTYCTSDANSDVSVKKSNPIYLHVDVPSQSLIACIRFVGSSVSSTNVASGLTLCGRVSLDAAFSTGHIVMSVSDTPVRHGSLI